MHSAIPIFIKRPSKKTFEGRHANHRWNGCLSKPAHATEHLLRQAGTHHLSGGGLVKVAVRGLGQRTHHTAHILLGLGADLGDNLLNQGS